MGAGVDATDSDRSTSRARARRSHDEVPVSTPGDRHEIEARAVAGQLAGATSCSRCAAGAPCATCGRAHAARGGLVPDAGRPLAPTLRATAEAQLGPLGDVRLHTGAAAARAAARLDARAYAYGTSIVFGADEFAPSTPAGRALLLHELRHTQQDPRGAMVHRQPRTDGPPPPEAQPTLEQVVANSSLFTDAMIDELLADQAAVDAREDEAPSPVLDLFMAGLDDGLGPAGGFPLAEYDRRTHWEGSLPGARRAWVNQHLAEARFTSIAERDHYRGIASGFVSDLTTGGSTLVSAPAPRVDLSSWLTPTPAPRPANTCASCHQPVATTPPSLDAWSALADAPAPTYRFRVATPPRPTDEEIENGEGRLWRRGIRGERIRINGYAGPPRARYTKPYAIMAAERGDYEYAELAENYMCPTCHIVAAAGHMPSDSEFSIGAYERNYRANYVWLFNLNPISSAWNLGVTTGEVITGESSGLNLNEVMMGEAQPGRRFSDSERAWKGVDAGIGWLLLGLSARSGGGPRGAPEPPVSTYRPWTPRVIQGGGMPRPSVGGTSGPYYGGAAAPALDVAPAAAPRLSLVPDPVPTTIAPPAPQLVPWADVAPAALPFVQPSQYVNPSPSQSPWPRPQPQPDPDDNTPGCPRGSHVITWPFPTWTLAGHGDSGATSGLYDFPPNPILVRRRSPARNRALRDRYVRNNIAALAPHYYNGRMRGAIHHKVPLYVSGPDAYDNFVFVTNSEHTGWHNALARQGRTGWMIRDPYGTVYCAT